MQAAKALLFPTVLWLALPLTARAQSGIAVTDPLIVSKCGACHPPDAQGMMQRMSRERAAPEGWQEVLKRMIREQSVNVSPAEARSIVRYLSTRHGLAPEEAKPVMYYAERRVREEARDVQDAAQAGMIETCGKCHDAARPLSWRRSQDDWKQFTAEHAARFKFKADDASLAYLVKAAPLTTPEWTRWSSQTRSDELIGKWLVTGHLAGRGNFYGEMSVEAGGAEGEFVTHTTLNSVLNGASLVRTGRNVVYGGSAWRGRSQGQPSQDAMPDDPGSEAREVMWISPGGAKAEGRWFWGQYSEFGFDVKMQRASDATRLLLLEPTALKTGSSGNRLRLIGSRLPSVTDPADVHAGPDVQVKRIISSTPTELAIEADVAATAAPGRRDVAVNGSSLPDSLTIYDRVDYVRVTPESSVAAFGSDTYKRGFQHYEAIGVQRGADGKPHTADDLELGPVDVTWSMEVFYETDPGQRAMVGKVGPTGFFTPASQDPGNNFDVWIVATAKDSTKADGTPLIGKGYVVVTVPTYTFNGRKYVRELDRWIEEGSSTR